MSRGLSKQQRALIKFLSDGKVRSTERCASFLAQSFYPTRSQLSSTGRALHGLAAAGRIGKIERRTPGVGGRAAAYWARPSVARWLADDRVQITPCSWDRTCSLAIDGKLVLRDYVTPGGAKDIGGRRRWRLYKCEKAVRFQSWEHAARYAARMLARRAAGRGVVMEDPAVYEERIRQARATAATLSRSQGGSISGDPASAGQVGNIPHPP
jgi:hypothetical protein